MKRIGAAWLLILAYSLPTSVEAQILSVTLIGTGMPQPQIERFGPSVLVEAGRQKLIVDAGRGVAQRVYQLYIPFSQINKVFITHLHYDHLLGIADLMLSGWEFQRKTPVEFYGPRGLAEHLDHLMRAYDVDIHFRREHSKLDAQGIRHQVSEIDAGIVYEHDGLKVTAFEVDHKPLHPAFGFRIDYGGRSVVISGDTRYSKEVLKAARGADLLIHEVAAASRSLLANNERLRNIMSYHTSPEDLARLLAAAKPRLAVLVHILAFEVDEQDLLKRVSAGHDIDVRVGKDLMAFDIGDLILEYTRPR